jgi:hypothetical protein
MTPENPYEDFFESSRDQPQRKQIRIDQPEEIPEEENIFEENIHDKRFKNSRESLDEVLVSLRMFQKEASNFSKLLSETRAIQHRVISRFSRLFFSNQKDPDKKSLAGERAYHRVLTKKFRDIIQPMKHLAEIHLQTVKQFNRDIGEDYYSIEKEDHQIKQEKKLAVNGINLQRSILSDAAADLAILTDALNATEKRMDRYVDMGNYNNISSSELKLLVAERKTLTSGLEHQFQYGIFDINIIDKTVLQLGGYQKETSKQYLTKLLRAFNARS